MEVHAVVNVTRNHKSVDIDSKVLIHKNAHTMKQETTMANTQEGLISHACFCNHSPGVEAKLRKEAVNWQHPS